MIAAGYILPFVATVVCLITATVMAFSSTEDDPWIEDDETTSRLVEQRRMLIFPTVLVACWIVGNVPLLYLLRGSPSQSVEAVLILVIVSHHAALPIAMFLVRRRHLWLRVGGCLRAFRRRTVRNRGTCRQSNHHVHGDEETDIDADSRAGHPEAASPAEDDGPPQPDSELADGDVRSRLDKEPGDVDANQEKRQLSEDVDIAGRLFSVQTVQFRCTVSRTLMRDSPSK